MAKAQINPINNIFRGMNILPEALALALARTELYRT